MTIGTAQRLMKGRVALVTGASRAVRMMASGHGGFVTGAELPVQGGARIG